MTCEQTRLLLGVYVLGAADPSELAEVDGHVGHCTACATELADLLPLPGLLSLLTEAELDAELQDVVGPTPVVQSADGYDRLLARARLQQGRTSRRPRARSLLAAVAAVVLLVIAGVAVGHWPAGPSRAQPHSYSAVSGPVRMTVALTDQVRGTALEVKVDGLPSGEQCHLVAVGRDSTREPVGSWQATYAGHAWAKAAMSLRQDQLAALVLLADDGQPLVTLTV
jgi:anti-sigma factor RsiW